MLSFFKFEDIETDDIEDPNHLNLEQVVIQAEENRIKIEAQRDKEATLATLKVLAKDFAALMKR